MRNHIAMGRRIGTPEDQSATENPVISGFYFFLLHSVHPADGSTYP
jgi:hypothetical protein